MVATVRCEEIANEKFESLCTNEVNSCFDIFDNFIDAKMLHDTYQLFFV